jgi:hypothetical protein
VTSYDTFGSQPIVDPLLEEVEVLADSHVVVVDDLLRDIRPGVFFVRATLIIWSTGRSPSSTRLRKCGTIAVSTYSWSNRASYWLRNCVNLVSAPAPG